MTPDDVAKRQREDAEWAAFQSKFALWFEGALNGSVTFPESSGGQPLTSDERMRLAMDRYIRRYLDTKA